MQWVCTLHSSSKTENILLLFFYIYTNNRHLEVNILIKSSPAWANLKCFLTTTGSRRSPCPTTESSSGSAWPRKPRRPSKLRPSAASDRGWEEPWGSKQFRIRSDSDQTEIFRRRRPDELPTRWLLLERAKSHRNISEAFLIFNFETKQLQIDIEQIVGVLKSLFFSCPNVYNL